jgi:DNA-binding NarL/FixJ family response regulator
VAVGLSNREIGKRLIISEGNVKIHLSNIYLKLGIDSLVDLTVLAREKGLV